MSDFPIKPLWNNVIIKRIDNNTTKLIVPKAAEDILGDQNRFQVVAVGPGRPNLPCPVEVGQEVVLSSMAGCTGLEYGVETDQVSQEKVVNYFMLPDSGIGGIFNEA